MGILTDLFVAEPQDAQSYQELELGGKGASGKFEGVQFKGLLDLNFAILWALLEGKEWDLNTHALEEVSMGESGETWLFKFPDPLVTKLAGLDGAGVKRAAELWSKTEELMCEPAEMEPVVTELVRLARLSSSSTKRLFLWGSL